MQESTPAEIRSRGIRLLASGIVCLVGCAVLGVMFKILDDGLTQTHQRLNPNNGLLTVMGGGAFLLVVLGPILTIAGALQLITRKNIWHTLTKPM